MNDQTSEAPGMVTLAEMKEFASFAGATQRYIRRSLDVALEREDAVKRWSRDVGEVASIRAQYRLYERLDALRGLIPTSSDIDAAEPFMAPLITISAFDLGQGRIDSFASYRFLYERLLGPDARPWLPGAFCGAATLPQLLPEQRKILLQSITEAAATATGWSKRAPSFFPEWVEKVDAGNAS